MYSNVIFFANDFGYGPTSNALSIARGLIKHGVPVTLVTAKQNDSILTASGVPIEHISDLRDSKTIAEYLAVHSDPSSLVVSVMNRFAITAAKEVGRTCAFVDDLFWFWREGTRPTEYATADIQICCVLPWQLKAKKPTDTVRYACVQADESKENYPYRSQKALYSFNGLRTPFYTEKHDIYVLFMGQVVRELASQEPLAITGPEYIRPLIEPFLPRGTMYTPLPKTEYLDTLASVKTVYLNGGQNSFLEAIISNTPTTMVLPSNQSQYGLLHEIAQELKVAITDICPLLKLIPNHERMISFTNEREALDAWSDMLADVLAEENSPTAITEILRSGPRVTVPDFFIEWRTAIEQHPSIDKLILDILQS